MSDAQSTWLTDFDRQMVIRCLGMTGSTFDGEALNAIRTANHKIRAAGLVWMDVINHRPNRPLALSKTHTATSRATGLRVGVGSRVPV